MSSQRRGVDKRHEKCRTLPRMTYAFGREKNVKDCAVGLGGDDDANGAPEWLQSLRTTHDIPEVQDLSHISNPPPPA